MELNFPKIEKKILKFWKENRTFEKSIEQRKNAPNFVFYEGPPTVNADPGIHHILSRVFKDIICRYKTMKGFKVLRKGGWDTHGLPVELEIEKKLGLKTKRDVEKYGIAKFNGKCQNLVKSFIKKWEKLTERIGYWLDMDNPYITYKSDYIETLWWILKEIWRKDLLYEDYKVVPYCPRCGTSLSSHEVALGYERIKEPAIYIKFKIKDPKFENTYLLVWTTTPWTLPGNVAVAVNPGITYLKIKTGGENLILARDRMASSGIKGDVLEAFEGKDLLGLEYEPLYEIKSGIAVKKAYFIIAGDFVSTEEGTGLVHIAPAFGEEDMIVIRKENSELKTKKLPEFPVLITVDQEGKMVTPNYKWDRLFVKNADPLIVNDLKERQLLFKEELYEHDYPFCWRCHTPLLYYSKKSWFIKVTVVKDKLIKNNQKINWYPAYLKEGRFGEWLREVKDWAISRERYWGTPLPIWKCRSCGAIEAIGSIQDLSSKKFSNNNYFILRHGEATTNKRNIVCCWPEKISCPLTKKGAEEVSEAAKKLKKQRIDVIFSSDLLRAKQTAEIISEELGLKIIYDKRVREVDMGILNGKSFEKARRLWDPERKLKTEEYHSKRFEVRAPGGENFRDVKKRMNEFLRDIDDKYKDKNILIISHEAPLSLLEASMKGIPDEKFFEFRKKRKFNTGELRKIEAKFLPYDETGNINFHRPFVDEVKFFCKKCNRLMERVPEVIDCWFDSGAMPFAQYHYPFENAQLIDKKERFPADFISEAIDQTRGWFYTLLAISTLLGLESPYKNVVSLGHVLDEKGNKMSKSKGNIVNPWYIVEKYGIDNARWYFFTINKAEDPKLFSEKDISESLRKFTLNFWNCFSFFDTYTSKEKLKTSASKNILDRWIVSELSVLISKVTASLEKYNITDAARLIEDFVINKLSLWYIRRSRKRFQKPKDKKELKEASQTLGVTLSTLNKLLAPFTPFLSEEICSKLKNKKSVHLEDWPMIDKKLIDERLNKQMEKIREIITLVLAERVKAKIKVRQPLNELQITNQELKGEEELLELLKEEVNVKKISFGEFLKLDTKITKGLREEGEVREIIRNVQELRKIGGYRPKDIIYIYAIADNRIKTLLIENEKLILKETKAKKIKFKKNKRPKVEKEILIDNQKLWLAIKK